MYQHLILSIMLAAPVAAQTPATQKPAAGATQKPATEKPAAGAAAKGVRTVEIIGTEDMKYSVPTITAKPGEQIRVRLTAKGSMPKIAMAHNFVLLNKTAKVTDFVTAAMGARPDFIPVDALRARCGDLHHRAGFQLPRRRPPGRPRSAARPGR